MKEIHLELLVGRRVVDANGKHLGAIEEVLAERDGDDLVVTEVEIGRAGLEERLSIRGAGGAFTGFFGAHLRSAEPKRIPIEELDLSDPDHPVWRK